VQRAGRVIAVEKDAGLFRWLHESLGHVPNLELIHADALDVIPEQAPGWGVTRLVSNLPYSVGSRILMDLFALAAPPLSMTVTIQLEVADRLAAGAGHAERGLLSVWAQRWYDVKVVKKISPTCFMPRPKVMSAVVRLTRHAGPPAGGSDFFRDLTRACFGYRRKQIGTILARVADDVGLKAAAAVAVLGELGIDPKLRPETFTVDTWERLATRLAGLRCEGPGTGSI
jgi:16S rRNA (adenine1518-N6/adenine1519-N6)-dimethyltransferase